MKKIVFKRMKAPPKMIFTPKGKVKLLPKQQFDPKDWNKVG